MKWEEVDERLAITLAETDLDQATGRRKIREAFKDVQLSLDHCLLKVFSIFLLLSLYLFFEFILCSIDFCSELIL